MRLGDPKDYAGYNVVNPKVLQAYSIIVKKDVYKEAREMVKEFISKLIITSKLLPTTWSALGSFIDTLSEEENSELNKIYKQGIQAVETIQKKPDVSQVSLGNYTWWQYISSRALATAASIGIVFLEHELRKMVDNPREYGLEPFYYISTGEYFLHSSAKFEPWVANPDLMTDLIHKNHLGYAVWGVLVGNKIREIGWQNKKGVDDSIGSKKFHSMIQSLLNSVRARYEGRLKEIERELESQIASLRERAKERLSAASNGLRSINEQLAELEREAARKREEARIQYERERIAAEEEARRLEAEWRLRQEENARLERERLAAEEEARRRREQEEMLLNVAACFFFGWCKR